MTFCKLRYKTHFWLFGKMPLCPIMRKWPNRPDKLLKNHERPGNGRKEYEKSPRRKENNEIELSAAIAIAFDLRKKTAIEFRT
jgi:hypothetical protein